MQLANTGYNPSTRTVKLFDFGCSLTFWDAHLDICTRSYAPPEILLENPQYQTELHFESQPASMHRLTPSLGMRLGGSCRASLGAGLQRPFTSNPNSDPSHFLILEESLDQTASLLLGSTTDLLRIDSNFGQAILGSAGPWISLAVSQVEKPPTLLLFKCSGGVLEEVEKSPLIGLADAEILAGHYIHSEGLYSTAS